MPELNFVSTSPTGTPGQIQTPYLGTVVPGYNYGNTGGGYLEFGDGTPGSLPFRVDQSGNISAPSFGGLSPSGDSTGAADTANIQGLLNLASPGGTVQLGVGTFSLNAQLTIPPGVSLKGSFDNSGALFSPSANAGTVLQAVAAFSATSVIQLTDVGAAVTRGGSIENLCIDGSLQSSGTTDGINMKGPIHREFLRDIYIKNMSGHGIGTAQDSGVTGQQYPYSLRAIRVLVDTCTGSGISLNNVTDSTWVDCESIFSTGDNWFISGCGNSTFLSCRGEWSSAGYGFHVSGSNGDTLTMLGCSTDRNFKSGVKIDCTAGTAAAGPVSISALRCTRDGRNNKSGGGSYSGLEVNGTTIPVILNGVTVVPGTDDDGTGTNSPQYGISVISSPLFVSIDNAYMWGNSQGWRNDGTATTLKLGANLAIATGTQASPTVYAAGEVTIIKPADQTINDSTTFQNDNALFASLPVSTTWEVEMLLSYDGSTTGDFKAGWASPPSGATAVLSWAGGGTGASSSPVNMGGIIATISASSSFGGVGVGTAVPVWVRGTLTMSSTAGTLQLQWAQNTLDATILTLHAGSMLKLRQVS